MSLVPTPNEVTALATLRQLAGDTLDAIYLSQETALRFLRARGTDPKKALAALQKYAAWRAELTPWWPQTACPLEHITAPLDSGKAFFSGVTRDGHPLLWVRPALHNAHEDRLQLRRFVSALNDEAAARLDRAPSFISTHAIILDFQVSFPLCFPPPSANTPEPCSSSQGFGLYHGFDINAGVQIVTQLMDCFPERLFKLVITREPTVFWMLWKVVSALLDERVRAKVFFVKPTEIASTLDIDLSLVPSFLPGGTSPYVYDAREIYASPSSWVSVRDGPFAHLARVPGSKLWPVLAEAAPAPADPAMP